MFDYLQDPAEIYRRSFAIIRTEVDLSGLRPSLADVAVRLMHACGMTDIVADLAWSDDAVERASVALASGAPVLTDTRMVADGILKDRLPRRNTVRALIDDPRVADEARRTGTTRSAAAISLAAQDLDGSILAIGNAPTALFRLLEILLAGAMPPAAILAFPVGFVGASESKDALIRADIGVPFITLRGRRGGSALAAAAVNSIAGSNP
ncbi:MAG: precorrin-8X methylmutase [Alphaproteobacteria bacterium]|nr:precorrin-8X methylmutase [Alphaproteobacteria bacterium]